jgi:hypothetical protein
MSTPTIPFATAGFISGGTFTYYGLLSDGDDVVSRPGTLQTAAAKQLRGAILHIDAATSAVTLPAVFSDCNCILAIDCDATLANAPCQVYVGGKFKADAVIWPAALSHALVTEALRDMDIQIESVEFTDGSLVKSMPTEVQADAAKKVIAENEDRVKQAKAEAKPDDPGRDSPWGYLTAEERQNKPELATIHDRDDKEKEDQEKANQEKSDKHDKPKPTTTAPPPPHHMQHGSPSATKPKGGD